MLLNRFEDIGKKAWNALVFQNNINTIFQTYEWNTAWWEIYGEDSALFIVCVKNNNKVTGIAPLWIYKKGKRRILKFIGHVRSDYLDFIYLEGESKILYSIFKLIKEKSNEWDEIVLERIPDCSSTASLIREICHDNGIYCLKYNTIPYLTLNIRDEPGIVRQVQSKKSLIRHRNYFLKQGEYNVYHITNRNEIKKYLECFFQQHIERWGVTRTPSLFLDQKNCKFYNEILKLADTKRLVFSVVESKGLPIAFHFGFAYNNKFVWYKPSFDITLFNRSPGEVLLKELLDFTIKNNYYEFDFTIGDEAFKRRFANRAGENYSYKVVKSSKLFWFYILCAFFKKTIDKNKFGILIKDYAKQIKGFNFIELIAAIKRIFNRFIFSYNRALLFEIPSNYKEKEINREIENIKTRYADIKDLYKFNYLLSVPQKQNYMIEAFKRFKKRDKCLVAEYLGKIIGMMWISENDMLIADVIKDQNVKNKSILIYSWYIIPGYEEKAYYIMLNQMIKSYYNKSSIIFNNIENIEDKKDICNLGILLKKKLYLLKCMGINIRWEITPCLKKAC